MPGPAGTRLLAAVMTAGLVTSLLAQAAVACPFCFGSQQLTLRERLETPDAAVLVEWQTGEPGDINEDLPASTTFQILKVWRGEIAADESLRIDRYQEGRAGDRFLLVGNKLDDAIRWDRAIPLSSEALEYVRGLPTSDAPITQRLQYAFKYLEAGDVTIANDAFAVVANAKYADLVAAGEYLSVRALRTWVHDPDTLVMRLGVYGMLLGLAGDKEDIPRLQQKIFALDNDRPIRIGIDGVMGGYLVLAGTDGLSQLDDAYLKQADVTPNNLSAVTSALRFMWEYGEGRISKDRLRQSMRLALDHQPTLELAVIDLARWQDWTVTERLVSLYHDDGTEEHLRRKIIGFLIVATQAPTDEMTIAEADAVKLAAKTLDTIRTRDKELYRNAKRGLVAR